MSKQSNNKVASNEAVAVKKQLDQTNQDEVFTFANGVSVKLHPVGSYVVREAQLKIKRPIVPQVPHPNDPNDPSKFMENPHDPEYQQALIDYDAELERVSVDAMMLFGIEVLEGFPPESNRWFKNLKMMNLVDENYEDLDEDHIEFMYKKYVLGTPDIITRITKLSGLTQVEVDKAVESFQR